MKNPVFMLVIFSSLFLIGCGEKTVNVKVKDLKEMQRQMKINEEQRTLQLLNEQQHQRLIKEQELAAQAAAQQRRLAAQALKQQRELKAAEDAQIKDLQDWQQTLTKLTNTVPYILSSFVALIFILYARKSFGDYINFKKQTHEKDFVIAVLEQIRPELKDVNPEDKAEIIKKILNGREPQQLEAPQ